MANHKSLWTAPALSLLLMSGVTAPTLGLAAEKSVAPDERVAVRVDEEERLAGLDNAYVTQLKSRAEQMRNAAKAVEKQGGDPTGLLAAADYFDDQTQKLEEKEKIKVQ